MKAKTKHLNIVSFGLLGFGCGMLLPTLMLLSLIIFNIITAILYGILVVWALYLYAVFFLEVKYHLSISTNYKEGKKE